MGRTARCRIAGPPRTGPGLLRVTGGGWGQQAAPLHLAATVNGRPAGRAAVGADLGHCVFPIELAASLDVALEVDRTFSVRGDDRALGMMVRSIDVIDLAALEQPVDADGWFEWETHEYFPFHWMGPTARLVVPPSLLARGGFAQLPVASDCADGEQELSVSAGHDGAPVLLPLLHGWHLYDLPLPEGADATRPGEPLWLTFSLNQVWPASAHPQDRRELGARVGLLEVHGDRRRHESVRRLHSLALGAADTAAPRVAAAAPADVGLPVEGGGWFAIEHDEQGPFRWMAVEGQLRLPGAMGAVARYCVLSLFSSFRDLSQEVTVLADGRPLQTIQLLKAWNTYSLELPPHGAEDVVLTLRLNKIPPLASHDHDPRPLGIRVSRVECHDDPARHERQSFLSRNAATNQRELREGATVLSSFPQLLGIDLYGKCNIKPACVYCLWDPMKALEGKDIETPVDDRTLAGYGEFFRGAKQVVNCSFGEPLLHPRFEEVVDFMAASGKMVELSSNGQAFTGRTVRALEGRPVELYVSLDSATPETYARLRNDRWHEVVSGLLFLRDSRRRGRGWPRLNLVFMPMRANRDDVEAYFRLCRLVEADRLVLRPLLYLENPGIESDRGGYHFDYERELLGRDELEPIFAECGRFAAKYGVRVVSQFDFGKIEAPAIGEAGVRA
jgi:hypothetical protein